MRSTSIFVVFGGLLVALLVWTIMNNLTTSGDPAMKTAQAFMLAVSKQDAATLTSLVDKDTTEVTKAGNNITSLQFKELNATEGAFLKCPAYTWTYADLSTLTMSTEDPLYHAADSSLATVSYSHDVKMYLHKDKADGKWKVFYITAPVQPKQPGQA